MLGGSWTKGDNVTSRTFSSWIIVIPCGAHILYIWQFWNLPKRPHLRMFIWGAYLLPKVIPFTNVVKNFDSSRHLYTLHDNSTNIKYLFFWNFIAFYIRSACDIFIFITLWLLHDFNMLSCFVSITKLDKRGKEVSNLIFTANCGTWVILRKLRSFRRQRRILSVNKKVFCINTSVNKSGLFWVIFIYRKKTTSWKFQRILFWNRNKKSMNETKIMGL